MLEGLFFCVQLSTLGLTALTPLTTPAEVMSEK